MRGRLFFLLPLLVLFGPARAFEPPPVGPGVAVGPVSVKALKNPGSPVLLQGFHWTSHRTKPWWGVIAGKAGEIAGAGFDWVWLPPSSEAISDEGYLPSRLYRQDSKYGSSGELRAAVSALASRGVGAVADIVINHRVGTHDWADFTEPAWGPEAVCRDDEWPGARGGADSGFGYHAGRDIDHSNPAVRESIASWLRWLKDEIGYAGWRFDYARGFAAEYLDGYNRATAPSFSVVEIWDGLDLGNPDAHRQALADYLDSIGGRSSAFDFTTKGVLQQAVSAREYGRLRGGDGRPAGLIGWWPEKSVTFIDNHDTGPSPGGGQNYWAFPPGGVMEGYAYILTHPGTPCVYWPHFFDWGLKDEISTLIAIRKNAGIGPSSRVEILTADGGRYAAVIDGRVAMKIGPGDWSPREQGWRLAAFGSNYAVWTR